MATKVMPLLEVAAAMQGGGGGLILFALDARQSIWSMQQQGPGGAWSSWSGPKFGGQPVAGAQLAAAGQNNGCLMLVMLDSKGMMWTLSQNSPGGGWGQWQGPGVGGQQFGFNEIAAAQQGGNRGIQIFATDSTGQIWALYQTTPGGAWSSWEGPGFRSQTLKAGEVALAGQNNGDLMLFAEGGGHVAAIPQLTPGGDWGGWQSHDAPVSLVGLCAAEQGGNRGVELWGIDQSDGYIWTLYQTSPGGSWSNWEGPGFKRQTLWANRLAAANQGNGNCMLIVACMDGTLWSIAQTAPGGDWDKWQQLQAPPAPLAAENPVPPQPA